MYLYFLLIRIAALFGHNKARMLVRGQGQTLAQLKADGARWKSPIWIHAASVGEFEQARPIIERLRREQPARQIVVTFFSPSGFEARKNYAQVDGVYYLPFATIHNAKRFVKALNPSMAVFVKYEFWPAYLRELKKCHVPTYSICAIFRKNQVFFRIWGKLYLRMLRNFTHIYVQDEESRRLLAEHGIHHSSVAGDTRFDRVQEVMLRQENALSDRLTVIAQFAEGFNHVIVAGSTWPKDEKLLERYMREAAGPDTKLIVVPHEIDEAHLHYLFNLYQGRMVRYSDVFGKTSDIATRNILQQAKVLLVDTIGLLSALYRFGQVAYIGGGFGVGIHNTLEPAVYGMPVIFGPNYKHFREAIGLIKAGGAKSIKKYSELEAALHTALDQYQDIGAKAAQYVQSELGATETIYKEIF